MTHKYLTFYFAEWFTVKLQKMIVLIEARAGNSVNVTVSPAHVLSWLMGFNIDVLCHLVTDLLKLLMQVYLSILSYNTGTFSICLYPISDN